MTSDPLIIGFLIFVVLFVALMCFVIGAGSYGLYRDISAEKRARAYMECEREVEALEATWRL